MQVCGNEMCKWMNELCPILIDMLQDASSMPKREVCLLDNNNNCGLTECLLFVLEIKFK